MLARVRALPTIAALLAALSGCWQAPADPAPPPPSTEIPPEDPSPRERLDATLISVTDGDTIRVQLGGVNERVRLIGIDTPETEFSPRGPEPFADEATEALRALLPADEPLELEFDVEVRDRYGRMLAYVYSSNGTFANAAMVEQGWARPLTIAPNVTHAETFFRLAGEAREAGVGIWAE